MSPYRKPDRPDDFFVREGARVRVACSFRERLRQWWWGGFKAAAWHGRVGTVLWSATYYGCPCGSKGCCVDLTGGTPRDLPAAPGVLVSFMFSDVNIDEERLVSSAVVMPLGILRPA